MLPPVIVIGASSGGLSALSEVLRAAPANLPAAVLVVQHLAPRTEGNLPALLARASMLPVTSAADRQPLTQGQVFVAPADRHLLVDRERMRLSRGPRENRTRPAIDPLFRSAAVSHGPAVIGVLLSGALDDGTAGMDAIRRMGGRTIAQEPTTAENAEMPQSAIDAGVVDDAVPLGKIGPLLGRLAEAEPPSAPAPSDEARALRREVDLMLRESGAIIDMTEIGTLAPASCPECGGPMWDVGGDGTRFRCHTGHAYTARHLVDGLQEEEERALWVALRVMEERVRMLRRLADRSGGASSDFERKANEDEQHVRRLRELLSSRIVDPDVSEEGGSGAE